MKVRDERRGWTKIPRDVRQSYTLSPHLFSLYSQTFIDELQDVEEVRIGHTNVNNIRFTDDTVLMADTEEKLQSLVDDLNEAYQRKGLLLT